MSRWSDRHRAMLAAMGLRTWSPGEDAAAPAPADMDDSTSARPRPVPAAAAESPPPSPPPSLPPPAAMQRPVPPRLSVDPPVGASPPPAAPGPAAAAVAGLRVDAPSSPVDALDWPALQAAVEGCRACGLCESRRHTVFGVGHRQAHWMMVGEAPGEQEDLKGEPFVGAAGRLLDAMLEALGLTRDPADPDRQVYIANTLKCRPPQNRNPTPEELARCEPFLQRQIALVQPRVIVAMGRFAVQSLLRTDEAVGKLRGRVHRYAGVPLVVTYHPAYLLRQPADKAKAWDDLCRAAQLIADGSSAAG